MRVGQMEQSRGGGAKPRGVRYAYDELSAPPDEHHAIAQAKLESLRKLRSQNKNSSLSLAPQRKAPKEQKEISLISFDDDTA
jgi:hypothetical protein